MATHQRIQTVAVCLGRDVEWVEKCSLRMYESLRKNCKFKNRYRGFLNSQMFLDAWLELYKLGADKDNDLFVTITPKGTNRIVTPDEYVIIDSRLRHLVGAIRHNNYRMTWVYYKKGGKGKLGAWCVDAPIAPKGTKRRSLQLAAFRFKHQAIDYKWCCIFFLYPEIPRDVLLASVYEATDLHEEERYSGTQYDVYDTMVRMLETRSVCERLDRKYG